MSWLCSTRGRFEKCLRDVSIGKSERTKALGKRRLRWEDNIKGGLKIYMCVNWIKYVVL